MKVKNMSKTPYSFNGIVIEPNKTGQLKPPFDVQHSYLRELLEAGVFEAVEDAGAGRGAQCAPAKGGGKKTPAKGGKNE